jgi:BRCT domain type II-containing protein
LLSQFTGLEGAQFGSRLAGQSCFSVHTRCLFMESISNANRRSERREERSVCSEKSERINANHRATRQETGLEFVEIPVERGFPHESAKVPRNGPR